MNEKAQEKTRGIMAVLTKKTEGAKPLTTQPMRPPPNGGRPPFGRRSPKGEKPLDGGKIPPFIESSDIKKLQDHLKSHPANIEVEVSFGVFNTKTVRGGETKTFYDPGVSVTQFNAVLSYLMSLDKEGLWGNSKTRFDLAVTTEETEAEARKTEKGRFKKLRRITGIDSVVWLDKVRFHDEDIDNETWGYRIAKSAEKRCIPSSDDENTIKLDGDDKINISGFVSNFQRQKKRRTFLVVPKDSPFYGLKFDLTKVDEIEAIVDRKTGAKKFFTKIKHEIEIERKDPVGVQVFESAIRTIISVMQHASDANLNAPELITMPERSRIISVHNNMFKEDIVGLSKKRPNFELKSFCLFTGYENKPQNIKEEDLINPENKFYMTVKINGVRNFLLITSSGTYACSPPKDVWKIGPGVPKLNGTLLDVEVYIHPKTKQTTYYVFDILFMQGKDVRREYFGKGKSSPGRLAFLQQISPDIQLFGGATAEPKVFHHAGTLYENVAKAFEDKAAFEAQEIETDGLIAQSHLWYKNFFTRKWKDVPDLTIDFKLRRRGDAKAQSENEFTLYVGGKGQGEMEISTGCETNSPLWTPFMGSRRNSNQYASTIILPGGVLNVKSSSGLNLKPRADELIVECRWDAAKEKFVPVRYRDDKESPNYITVAESVWDDIVDPMTEETIRGDTLIAMRRFHNLIKMHFLKKEFGEGGRIMDWGSGRGGDLNKWKKLGLSTVYVVEPNGENFTEFQRRQRSMEVDWKGTGPEIIPIQQYLSPSGDFAGGFELMGAEQTDILVNRVGDDVLDGIVSFFSLTFFGKSKEMFDKMIESINQLLPVGGKFLGIVMDGQRTQELLEQDKEAEKGQSLLYDCPAFTIRQKSAFAPDAVKKGKNEIKIVIKEATSMVKQNEWLFYFSTLRTALEAIGFELKYEGFLDSKSPLISIGGGNKGKERPPGQIFDTLPAGGKVFSSLNHYFMFERMSKDGSTKKPSKAPKPAGPKKALPGSLDENTDFGFDFLKTVWGEKIPESEGNRDFFLVRPVPPGTSYGFIHSVLFALSAKYKSSNFAEREARVERVVAMMARKLTVKLYRKVMRGSTYDLHGKVIEKEEISDEDMEIELVKFQIGILEGKRKNEASEVWADILSHLLGINILRMQTARSVTDASQEVIELDSERGNFGCFENTIVIYALERDLYPKDREYSVVADAKDSKEFLAYQTKTPFIRRIIETIAASKKKHGAVFKIAR